MVFSTSKTTTRHEQKRTFFITIHAMRFTSFYVISTFASLVAVVVATPASPVILSGDDGDNSTLVARDDQGCGGVQAISQCAQVPGSTGGCK
jgi:hypothetical protein